MSVIFYFIIIVSILLNILVLILDFIPNIYPKLIRKLRPVKVLTVIPDDYEETILKAAFNMANSNKVTMVWEDRTESFTQKLLGLFKKRKSNVEFRKYNYPRAFLLLGILSYIIETKDEKYLKKFKLMFEAYITENGTPTFTVNRVDQAPMGIVSLLLYNTYNEKKYLLFSKEIYEYIIRNIDLEIGIVDYRTGAERVLNDMLGLTVPFLIEYGRTIKDETIIEIAKRQIYYYISFGTDSKTNIPSHGLDKKTKVKVGSSNWGRGIGWYFVSLSWYNKYYTDFEKELSNLQESVLQLKNKESLWTQFPGTSSRFDASTTTMFLYSLLLNKPNYLDSKGVMKLLKNYLSTDGYILETSGDTYGLNNYSKSFGKSELSQGFMLLLLSSLKK